MHLGVQSEAEAEAEAEANSRGSRGSRRHKGRQPGRLRTGASSRSDSNSTPHNSVAASAERYSSGGGRDSRGRDSLGQDGVEDTELVSPRAPLPPGVTRIGRMEVRHRLLVSEDPRPSASKFC